jgi:hypothetical protein
VAIPVKGKTKALRQLEEEFKGVKAEQKLLYKLLSKSRTTLFRKPRETRAVRPR